MREAGGTPELISLEAGAVQMFNHLEKGDTVALVDVLLPDRADGIDVVRELTRRGRPVVATSVSASVRNDALAAGALRFVEKSPDDQRLLSVLRHSAERCLDE